MVVAHDARAVPSDVVRRGRRAGPAPAKVAALRTGAVALPWATGITIGPIAPSLAEFPARRAWAATVAASTVTVIPTGGFTGELGVAID